MPIRNNSVYADPQLARAFDNLADVFKTPSGTDVLAYTKANAEREKAARLAALYADPNDPNFDRKNIAVGNYTPSQSYYAVDTDANTRLKTNAATNATTLAVTDKNNAAEMSRLLAKPVIVGDGQTAYLPPTTTAITGLPDMFRGNITAGQGQTVTTPTGETIAGPAKPPSEAEIKGAILGKLPASEQRAVVMAPAGVSAVQGPNGPTNVFTADSVGRTPYEKDTRNAQVANYKTPDGKVGTASLNRDTGKWADTQTGVEVPAGSQTYTANLQGDKDNTGLGVGTKNNIDGMLVDLALAQDTSKKLRDMVVNNPGSQGLVGGIRGTVQDVIQTGNEVGKLLNLNMAKMRDDIERGIVDPSVAAKFNGFDPSIPATQMLETLLTAQVAKVLDPNGRVSNDRYEQVKRALGSGGLTGNSARTLATLDQLDKIVADRRAILAPSAPAASKIGQTAPASSPTQNGTPQRRRFNPATGQLE